MRHRPIAVFFAGFACGLLFLAGLLFWSGKLRSPAAAPPPQLQSQLPAAAQPETSPAPAFQPLPEPPQLGEASRSANPPSPITATPPETGPLDHKLIVPVQGVQPRDLRDDFNETRGGHAHEALDIMAPRGTPVLAADEGNVVKLFLSKAGGLTVYQYDDSRTYCYYYAHLERYAPGLKEGMLLRKGEILGFVGTSGDAPPNSPHLHFAIFKLGPERNWWQGTPIDPYPLLAGSPTI